VLAASGDVLKGTLPTLAAIHLANLAPIAVVLVGMAAILGHTFPVFLNFKGGKAVATGGGVLLALFPLLTLIGLVAWVIGFSLTRISSVGSLTAAAVVAVGGAAFLLFGNLPLAYAVFVWATCGFVLYLHHGNIQRLRAGTENRFQKLR
jgi:glycerol-3-phosphate acyltransferase PlsY